MNSGPSLIGEVFISGTLNTYPIPSVTGLSSWVRDWVLDAEIQEKVGFDRNVCRYFWELVGEIQGGERV